MNRQMAPRKAVNAVVRRILLPTSTCCSGEGGMKIGNKCNGNGCSREVFPISSIA